MTALARSQEIKRPSRRHLEVLKTNYTGGEIERPRTRGDCANIPRPCPFVSCKHHVYLDVSRGGDVRLNFGALEPDELTVSCVLDVADDGANGFDYIAAVLGISKSRAEQINQRAIEKCFGSKQLKEWRP